MIRPYQFDTPVSVDSIALASALLAVDFPLLAAPERIDVNGAQPRTIFSFAPISNRGAKIDDALRHWAENGKTHHALHRLQKWWNNRKALVGFARLDGIALGQSQDLRFSTASFSRGYESVPSGLKSNGEIWLRDSSRAAAAFVCGARMIKTRKELGQTWYCFAREPELLAFFHQFNEPDSFSRDLDKMAQWEVASMAFSYKNLLAYVKQSNKAWGIEVNQNVAIIASHASEQVRSQVAEKIGI